MGRMTRSTELENLFSELYSALNAVILHVFHGRGAEVGDVELEAMLQQIHLHREVVLDSQNNQDKIFLTCFCRYLLQLLADSSVVRLQEVASQLWVDLILLQRAFMDDLLTVEIRKSGTPPYSVNLMKTASTRCWNVLQDLRDCKNMKSCSRLRLAGLQSGSSLLARL